METGGGKLQNIDWSRKKDTSAGRQSTGALEISQEITKDEGNSEIGDEHYGPELLCVIQGSVHAAL